MITDKETAIEILEKDGYALQYVDDRLKEDLDVVFAALYPFKKV